jgi:TetR/AcrR family fatty acid metabolism transcriptional regulator
VKSSSSNKSPPSKTRTPASSKTAKASSRAPAARTSRTAAKEPARAPTPKAAARTAAPAPLANVGRDDKRKQILKAAVKVFAERGYDGCRISDVAEEAGVAYGLVYHYFGNKDGLLASVFDTNWAVFQKAIEEIADGPGSTREKLTQIIEFVFSAFEMAPLVVKVLVLEFGRSARLGAALAEPEVSRVFQTLARIFDDARNSGELAPGVDPNAMSMLFMGVLETAFVSFVFRGRAQTEGRTISRNVVDAMKRSVLALLTTGGFVPVDRR